MSIDLTYVSDLFEQPAGSTVTYLSILEAMQTARTSTGPAPLTASAAARRNERDHERRTQYTEALTKLAEGEDLEDYGMDLSEAFRAFARAFPAARLVVDEIRGSGGDTKHHRHVMAGGTYRHFYGTVVYAGFEY